MNRNEIWDSYVAKNPRLAGGMVQSKDVQKIVMQTWDIAYLAGRKSGRKEVGQKLLTAGE